MTQPNIWQSDQQTHSYHELCTALYERELSRLAKSNIESINTINARLQSLTHYIQKTARLMTSIETPLTLDSHNASWSNRQSAKFPSTGQGEQDVIDWYRKLTLLPGLVIPIALSDHIVLDCIDRVDLDNNRFRSNVYGWHSLALESKVKHQQLFKPTKSVLMAACAGHCWQNNKKHHPVIPSLRELLISCQINWQDLKVPLAPDSLI